MEPGTGHQHGLGPAPYLPGNHLPEMLNNDLCFPGQIMGME